VASTNQCSLLVRNRASFDVSHERTLYTLFNLGIKGRCHEDPNAVHAAHVVHEFDSGLLQAPRYLLVSYRYLLLTEYDVVCNGR